MAKEKVCTKLWKPGQLVTLGEKRHVYRIVRAAANSCFMCQKNNKSMPCIEIFNYCENEDLAFSMNKCITHIPADCYPKRIY